MATNIKTFSGFLAGKGGYSNARNKRAARYLLCYELMWLVANGELDRENIDWAMDICIKHYQHNVEWCRKARVACMPWRIQIFGK